MKKEAEDDFAEFFQKNPHKSFKFSEKSNDILQQDDFLKVIQTYEEITDVIEKSFAEGSGKNAIDNFSGKVFVCFEREKRNLFIIVFAYYLIII